MSTIDFSELLGNYAEFAAAIAIVATLAYLAAQIRKRFALNVPVLLCLALSLQAAQPDVSEISGTWMGLDKATDPMRLSSVVVTITDAHSQSIGGALAIEGTLESTLVDDDSSGAAVATPGIINGAYAPDTGILSFRVQGPVSLNMIAVFNDDATAMVLLHANRGVNQAPFVLYKGNQIRASLRSLAEIDPQSAASKSSRKESGAQQRSQNNDRRAQYRQALKDLDAQIAAAVRARNKELTAELRQQKKAVRKDYAARPTTGMRRGRTSSGSGAGGCPEHVLAWASEMDNNGASLRQFKGYIELSNLFRPNVFEPHFGKPFAQLSRAELQNLYDAVQVTCTKDGSALATGGTRIPLGYVLNSRPGYGVTEAGIAGIALGLIAEWYQRTSGPILSTGTIEDLENLDKQGSPFLRMLWPAEISAALTRLSTGKQDRLEQRLSGQLTHIAAGLRGGEGWAVHDLEEFIRIQSFRGLDEPRVAKMRARIIDITDSGIADHLDTVRGRLTDIADPMARLIAGRAWYGVAGAALDNLAEYSPSAAPFWPLLGEDRELAYLALQPQLLDQVGALDHRPTLVSYGHDFKIPIDDVYSPSWRAIDAKRVEHLKSIDYAAHVVRVGEGPFGPDHLGAILLNAIYRNDLVQFGKEDTIVHEAFISQASDPVEAIAIKLAGLLVGGSRTAEEAEAWFEQNILESSMINAILTFFAVSYEHIYPTCMAPGAITITITTEYYTVISNMWGEVGRYLSDTTSTDYTINSRHMLAFKDFDGDAATPATIGALYDPWSSRVQESMKKSLEFLSNSLRGLRKAMQENACDSDLMTRLDQNMVHMYAAKNP